MLIKVGENRLVNTDSIREVYRYQYSIRISYMGDQSDELFSVVDHPTLWSDLERSTVKYFDAA
jgi:hypothetical protein